MYRVSAQDVDERMINVHIYFCLTKIIVGIMSPHYQGVCHLDIISENRQASASQKPRSYTTYDRSRTVYMHNYCNRVYCIHVQSHDPLIFFSCPFPF